MKRIKNWLEDWWKYIKNLFKYLGGEVRIELNPPTRLERERKRKKTLIILFIIAMIICCVFFVLPEVHNWNAVYIESWLDADDVGAAEHLSYIASFWGSIIGACIAVLATIFTTWAIIHGERKIDRHTERIAHLPIIEITYCEDLTEKLNRSKDKERFLKQNSIETQSVFDDMRIFSIRNVGEGIALKVDVTPSSSSEAEWYPYYETLLKNEPRLFAVEQEDWGYRFSPAFFDVFGNYYQQIIKFTDNGKMIEYTIPELVTRTKRFRYVQ